MTALRKHPKSPYWHAVIRRSDGTQTNRTTKVQADDQHRRAAEEKAKAIELEVLTKELSCDI